MDRMMFYLWIDPDHNDNEVKGGDHWVSDVDTVEDAIENTRKYIRTHQFPRRGRRFDEKVKVAYFDVSNYAKSVDKFYTHSKVDLNIFKELNLEMGSTGADFLVGDFDEIVANVDDLFKERPKEEVEFSTPQYDTAFDVIKAYNECKRRVLAELCARFGKTIWVGGVAIEIDADLIIVGSYVHTVFTSFGNDLRRWAQFKDIVHVNTKTRGYEEKIMEALESGKKVIAYLPLTGRMEGTRQDRIDFLFHPDLSVNQRMVIIDEGDYGAHKPKQVRPIKEAIHDNDFLIVMTGTNGDRAASEWDVDHTISVTYPELILAKREAGG